jgi:hypothetical protein
MNKSKKLPALILVATLAFPAATGCASASAWWQNFLNNPAAQVQTFEQAAQVALSIAEQSWTSIALFLPASVLATAQPVYNKAVVAVNAALNALNDAVQVAINAHATAPDFSALIQAVTDAVAQVVTVIDQFKASTAATASVSAPPPPVGLVELDAAVATMKRIGGTK